MWKSGLAGSRHGVLQERSFSLAIAPVGTLSIKMPSIAAGGCGDGDGCGDGCGCGCGDGSGCGTVWVSSGVTVAVVSGTIGTGFDGGGTSGPVRATTVATM